MTRHERQPDERYRAALRAQDEPTNVYEVALWRLARHGVGDDAIVRVVDAYEDGFERELLQAWIVAGATDEDLTNRLRLHPSMVAPYRHLCCNPDVFRDQLELLRWVKRYAGTREGKLLLERAVHLGVEAVAHLCGLPTRLDAAHVNEQTMRETYFRGMGTLRGSTISSAEAAAAHAMLKTSVAAASLTQRRGAPDLRDTLLRLKHRELTLTADEGIPRVEILN
jgi:hypothetical protein